jgi:hypothetical protein
MWHFWWTKWYWGWFSPSTSVSPVNSHSTNCSTLANRPTIRWYMIRIVTAPLNSHLKNDVHKFHVNYIQIKVGKVKTGNYVLNLQDESYFG